MIDASIDINTYAFEAGMQRLRDGVRRGVIDAQMGTLPVQARLLAERCQAFTPPRNVGQGKAAVTRDITGIFMPLSQSTFTNKGIKKIVRQDDRPAWDNVAQKMGSSHGLKNTKAIGFSEAFHRENRNRRGRAYRIKYGNIGFVTLGPEARKVRRYIAIIKKRVGWARAGWNAAIIGLGGAIKAQWMGKHGMGHGRVINASAGPTPYVQVFNETGWAGKNGAEGRRIIRNAIAARARDMQSYFERMMRVAAANAMGKAA